MIDRYRDVAGSVRSGSRMWGRVARFVAVATLLVAGMASGQERGSLQGRVVDARTGRPLTGARVLVVGTGLGATSAVEGRWTVTGIAPGTYTVQASSLGYAQKTITGVSVRAGASELDITLQPAAVAIQGLTVSAAAERGSVSRALNEQRTAVNVTSAISREEIQRGPDNDAAEAVQRVSGVTVESGKYVFVRGLGERYTTTQLNGARLPSSEPDRRVVPLDLFPAGTLEGITVSKTFTPDQSGDFSGAQVNLKTRNVGSPFKSVSMSMGFNDAVTFRDLVLAPNSGTEWLGFASGTRAIPETLAGGLGNMTDVQQSAALRQFRNVWTAEEATASPSLSLSASTGSTFQLGARDVQMLGALSYQNRVEAQLDETRATVALRGTEVVPLNEFTANTGRRTVLWGGVLNFGTTLGDHGRLSLNNTYDRTVENEALRLRGADEELSTELDITRLQLIERTVLATQLVSNHDWTRHALDASATFSRVTRDEPDRSELVYTREAHPTTGQPVWAFLGGATAPSTRAYGQLSEQSGALQGDYTLRFRDEEARLKVGSLYRFTARDAETVSFDFENFGLDLEDRIRPAGEIFGGSYYDPANLAIRLRSNTFGGTYTAREHIAAGYAMVEYPLSATLSVIGGARLEGAAVDVTSRAVEGEREPAELRDLDVLPSLALNARFTPEHTLRLSASRTLSRPEYRELAEITYRDYVGSYLVFGNPNLRRALIDNLDARWETYPSAGEAMSVGVFAKRFSDPIERVLLPATGAPVLTFRNADRAINYGVELELRRRLDFIAPALEAFAVNANATFVKSEVDFAGTGGTESATSQKRALLGQAPYVVNLGLTYEAPSSASATILFNARGERITEVGLEGIPDAYEQPRGTVDFAAELPLSIGKLRLEAGNLLDAETEIRQGMVTRMKYRTGRSVSIGLSFAP